jgi:hypothetical protein
MQSCRRLPWKGPANLETSACTRTVNAGALVEVVHLDGQPIRSAEASSGSFPIERTGPREGIPMKANLSRRLERLEERAQSHMPGLLVLQADSLSASDQGLDRRNVD